MPEVERAYVHRSEISAREETLFPLGESCLPSNWRHAQQYQYQNLNPPEPPHRLINKAVIQLERSIYILQGFRGQLNRLKSKLAILQQRWGGQRVKLEHPSESIEAQSYDPLSKTDRRVEKLQSSTQSLEAWTRDPRPPRIDQDPN